MIIGIGMDLVELERIKHSWKRFGQSFAAKVLHPLELDILPASPVNFLAGRFAAKEAAVKALGTGFSHGIWFHHFSILPDAGGRPILKLYGPALEHFLAMGSTKAHLSITHSRHSAAATVIFEGAGI